MTNNTNTQAPDTYVIGTNKSGTHFFQMYTPNRRGGYRVDVTYYYEDAKQFATLEEATAAANRLRSETRWPVRVYLNRGTVSLSDESKARVAARRAARNAERKF